MGQRLAYSLVFRESIISHSDSVAKFHQPKTYLSSNVSCIRGIVEPNIFMVFLMRTPANRTKFNFIIQLSQLSLKSLAPTSSSVKTWHKKL